MNKKKKILIIVMVVVVLFVSLVGFLLIPRAGKAKDEVWQGISSYNQDDITSFNFKSEEFTILQLTDIQKTIPFMSSKTLKKVVSELIEKSNPDLIVLTGDNVAGVFTHFFVNDLISIMDSFKLPWAPVFGNHDRELNANLYYQAKRFYKSEYCIFKEGPNNIGGVGNYVIDIKNDNKSVYSLFMMDSHNTRKYIDENGKEYKDYDYIQQGQIDWYADNVKAIAIANNDVVVPSMAFFHIPLPEYKIAVELLEKGSDKVELIYGEAREGVCSPPYDLGFFAKMKELNSTTHVFVGHDHVNNMSILYEGIYLTYGNKTGNFSYHDKDMNGGTVIKISKDGSVAYNNLFVNIQ